MVSATPFVQPRAGVPRRRLSSEAASLYCAFPLPGGMAEWLKAHAWKACIRATVSWVRIPLPPPASMRRRSPVTLVLQVDVDVGERVAVGAEFLPLSSYFLEAGLYPLLEILIFQIFIWLLAMPLSPQKDG
jgi:hypothetical protein